MEKQDGQLLQKMCKSKNRKPGTEVLKKTLFLRIYIHNGIFEQFDFDILVDFEHDGVVINGIYDAHYATGGDNFVSFVHCRYFILDLFLLLGLWTDDKKVKHQENGRKKNETGKTAASAFRICGK